MLLYIYPDNVDCGTFPDLVLFIELFSGTWSLLAGIMINAVVPFLTSFSQWLYIKNVPSEVDKIGMYYVQQRLELLHGLIEFQ